MNKNDDASGSNEGNEPDRNNTSLDLETLLSNEEVNTTDGAFVDDDVDDEDQAASMHQPHQNNLVVPWYNPLARISQLIADASWSEFSGSLGDLGTFLPLLTALGQARLVAVGPALLYAGLANIATGYVWDCPMPVQPMKSIAATALYASSWSAPVVTAAGVFMGATLTVLALIPRGVACLTALIPPSVVAGMQVGVGLSLAIHGLEWFRTLPLWRGLDSLALGLTCAVLTLVTLRPHTTASSGGRPPPPMALYLFGLASVLAMVQLYTGDGSDSSTNDDDDTATAMPNVHVWGLWALKGITAEELFKGFWEGAIPQLPLTLLNSVVSVCCLADSLFPERVRHHNHHQQQSQEPQVLPPRHVAASIGCINLLACPLGALPVCHGAGGLAAQYKFGARHGTSIVILGLCKVMAAVVAGPVRLLHFLDALPRSILAVLILVAGHELAVTGIASIAPPANNRNQEELDRDDSRDHHNHHPAFRTDIGICLWTAAVIVGLHKTHYGALTGCVAYVLQGPGYARVRLAFCGHHAPVSQTGDA